MAKKPVNFRIDENILAEFDKLPGSRTENLENAMKAYISMKADVNERKGDVNTGVNTGVNTDVNTDVDMYIKTIEILEDDKGFLQKQVEELQNANAEMRRLLLMEQQKAHTLPNQEEKYKAFWKRLLFWKKP